MEQCTYDVFRKMNTKDTEFSQCSTKHLHISSYILYRTVENTILPQRRELLDKQWNRDVSEGLLTKSRELRDEQ